MKMFLAEKIFTVSIKNIKVRELRKQTMSCDTTSSSGTEERRRGRVKSETSVVRKRHSHKQFEKSKSLANVNLRRKTLHSSATESIEEENQNVDNSEDTVDKCPGKKLTNLKEFYHLPGQTEPKLDLVKITLQTYRFSPLSMNDTEGYSP